MKGIIGRPKGKKDSKKRNPKRYIERWEKWRAKKLLKELEYDNISNS